jgi:hypothetical protein
MACGCTKHLLRLYRYQYAGECRETVTFVLCGLETYLYPHTVLFKEVAERVPFAS